MCWEGVRLEGGFGRGGGVSKVGGGYARRKMSSISALDILMKSCRF